MVGQQKISPPLLVLLMDPGSEMDKNQDLDSGINILDPQHWPYILDKFRILSSKFFLCSSFYNEYASKPVECCVVLIGRSSVHCRFPVASATISRRPPGTTPFPSVSGTLSLAPGKIELIFVLNIEFLVQELYATADLEVFCKRIIPLHICPLSPARLYSGDL